LNSLAGDNLEIVARFAARLRHSRVKGNNMSEPETFDQPSEKEIFFAALDKNTPEERAAFLDGACGKNPARRARVEALLADHFQTGEFMKKPAAADDRSTVNVSPVAEGPGARIGRYKLLQKIGEGGMGIVYMAEQEEPVRRRVALKIIKLGMDTKAVVARFEAERQALAMMDHPNIARVLDGGATETGRPYFVMELVQGVPITEFCDKNKLPARERLGLFSQVCHAIQSAHQKAIIHRDIKPSNVLVTLHHGEPMPKVIDFGIAKATSQKLTEKTLFTNFGTMIGTPAYMSPEQAEMSSMDVDTRSDVYSLGVLLYELLTGETPFPEKRLRSLGYGEMQRVIREEEPERPSNRLSTMDREQRTAVARNRGEELGSLSNLLKGDLDWIVMKCLEKDRARRYETANGLAMDLKRHLENEPVIARPASRAYRFQKMVRRNKLAFGAASAVAVSLILGLAVSSVLFVRERRALASEAGMFSREKEARHQADEARQQAQAAASRAEAAALEAKTTLSASEFRIGSRLLSEGNSSDGLAYLARSFRDNRANEEAPARLASLLASRAWMVPSIVLDAVRIAPGSPNWGFVNNDVSSAQFSPDGTVILTLTWDGTNGAARLWDAQTGRERTKPLMHKGPFRAAQFSPDGKRLVTKTDFNQMLRLWDAETGQPLSEPWKYGDSDVAVMFSPDGKRIIGTRADKTARAWDGLTGQPLAGPADPGEGPMAPQRSPDGKIILTTSWDGTNGAALLTEAQSGKALTGPLKHSGVVCSARFSPDGKRVVTASADKTARVWDAQSGLAVTGPLQHGDTVISAQFSPDGQRVLTASGDGTARVWDARTGQPLTEPLQHPDRLNSAQFSPDGRRILTITVDEVPRLWETVNGLGPLPECLPHHGRVAAAQFSPDGGRIVTASWDGAARIWDAPSGRPLTEPLKHDDSVWTAQFSPDGKRVVTAAMDGTARIWDARTGQPLTKPLRHNDFMTSAEFSADGKRVVTVSGHIGYEGYGGSVRVWDATSGQALTDLQSNDWLRSAQFSSDGTRIVAIGGDFARVWDARSGRAVTGPMKHGVFVQSAQFNPDGRRIVTASNSGTAQLWDAQTGQPINSPLQHQNAVNSAQFSPDGTRIVTASLDGTARVWDAQSGQPLTEPLKHTGAVNSAQFSPEGLRIVTASWDHTARVWDARSGQPLTEPMTHTNLVYSAQFSPDGKRVVTVAEDRIARVWDIPPGSGKRPAWLPRLAETLAGCALNQHGLLEPLGPAAETISQIRSELSQEAAPDDWTVWGRWFLADPLRRTISPFAQQTVPEYLEARLQERTTESLDEAQRLAGNNGPWPKRIAGARRELAEEEEGTKAAQLAKEKEMEARLVDVVRPTWQSETNHGAQGNNWRHISSGDLAWVNAGQDGWFSYEVKTPPDKAVSVVCSYLGQAGYFDILVNGHIIGSEKIYHKQQDEVFSREYAVPEKMTRGLDHVTLKFQPRPGGYTAGRLTGIRILRAIK
jgi:WD40 repeat protein